MPKETGLRCSSQILERVLLALIGVVLLILKHFLRMQRILTIRGGLRLSVWAMVYSKLTRTPTSIHFWRLCLRLGQGPPSQHFQLHPGHAGPQNAQLRGRG